MEVPQGNSLCNYIKQLKMSFFFFFHFTKFENRWAEQVLPGGLVPGGERGDGKKMKEGKYGTNTVCKCMQM
jgi:hypothetical protein